MADVQTEYRASPTIEEYLQIVYIVSAEGEKLTGAELARWMHVTGPTAWATVERMSRDGLVELSEKKIVRLTALGNTLAEGIIRRHKLSERFLTDMLGMGWADAHRQANHFEHGLTPMIEERIAALLGYPTTCPHGSPIPGTGAVISSDLVSLTSLQVGEEATVEVIAETLEEDEELLHYLDRHNVKPGKPAMLSEIIPSAEVVVIQIDGQAVPLRSPVAAKIKVRRA